MGTNFYAKRKINTQEKKEIHDQLDKFLSGDIYRHEFEEFLDSKIDEFHLGKRSGGWQFLWEYHEDRYKDSLDSILEYFITHKEYEIQDEYGRIFDLDQFINDEIDNTMYEGYNHDSYLKDHSSEPRIPPQYHDWITSDGLRFVKGDFS